MNTSACDQLCNLDLNRFYRIYVTIHEMLIDRGYKPKEKKLDKHKFISRHIGFFAELEDDATDAKAFEIIDKMGLLFTKEDKILLVCFQPLEAKLCQTDMTYIHKLMGKLKADHLIIVANNKATPKVANALSVLGSEAQLFYESDLITNITHHQLVPKHIRVTGEEREDILKYAILPDGKVHLDLLQGLFSCDPIAKYYNFKVDDLIRIERPRKDGYFDLSYRIVTPPITEKDKKGS